jgi:hypothetical protein
MGVSDEVRELLTLEGGREDVHVVTVGETQFYPYAQTSNMMHFE